MAYQQDLARGLLALATDDVTAGRTLVDALDTSEAIVGFHAEAMTVVGTPRARSAIDVGERHRAGPHAHALLNGDASLPVRSPLVILRS